jgi:hypothetical protein
MDARLVPTRSARPETVPKVSNIGSSSTVSAMRRSVGVNRSFDDAIRFLMDIDGTPMNNVLHYSYYIVLFVTSPVMTDKDQKAENILWPNSKNMPPQIESRPSSTA